MIFPIVSAEEWADDYAIPANGSACRKCGEIQSFTTPFAHGEFRGLLSNHMKCGEEFQQAIFVTISKSERMELAKFVTELHESTNKPTTDKSNEGE